MLHKSYIAPETVQAFVWLKPVFQFYFNVICSPKTYSDYPKYRLSYQITTTKSTQQEVKFMSNKHLYDPATILRVEDGLEICNLRTNAQHFLFTIVEADKTKDLLTFYGKDAKMYMTTRRKCSIITFMKSETSGWNFISAGFSHVLWKETGVKAWHFVNHSQSPFTNCDI